MEERRKYHERTGEKDDPLQSNGEWFSDRAKDNAIGAKPKGKVGDALTRIFRKFREYADALRKSASRFAKYVKEGKVSKELKSFLDRSVSEKLRTAEQVAAAMKAKKPTYQLKKKKQLVRELSITTKKVKAKKPNSVLKADLALYLNNRSLQIQKNYGVDLRPVKLQSGQLAKDIPEVRDIISDVIFDEIKLELERSEQGNFTAKGWYTEQVVNAMKEMEKLFPDLKEPLQRDLFKAVIAITSNNQKVSTNLNYAVGEYRKYLDTGKFDERFMGGGKAQGAMRDHFAYLNSLENELGLKNAMKFLTSKYKASDLTRIGKKHFGEKFSIDELANTEVYGSTIFGSKVGNGFLPNLLGDHNALTMDMWFMRTIGRIRGNLVERNYAPNLKKFRDNLLSSGAAKYHQYDLKREDVFGENEEKLITAADAIRKETQRKKYVGETQLERDAKALINNYKKVVDAPRNGMEKFNNRKIMSDVASKSGYEIDDSQAIIWFPEKRLYRKLGVRNPEALETNYEIEAKRLVSSEQKRYGGRKVTVISPEKGGRVRKRPTGIEEKAQVPTYELKKLTPEQKKLHQKQNGIDGAKEAVESHIEKENPEIERAQVEYDLINKENRLPVLSSIADAYKAVHSFVWAFGEARREDPALYDVLMESFGRRNAGLDVALDEIKKIMPRDISVSEAAEISLVYNDTRLRAEKEKTDPEFMEIYRPFEKLLKEYESRAKKDRLFQSDLKQRMLEEITNDLKKYRGTTSKGYKELIRIRDNIRAMQYLPQNIAVQKAIEHKYRNTPKKDRTIFSRNLGRISAQFKKRTSRLLLKDYIDKGFLEEKDIDIRKLAAEVIDSYYYKSSIKMLLDWANEKGMVKPTSPNLIDKGWYSTGDMGISSPELKNKMVHPLLGNSLKEMGDMKRFSGGGLFKRILGASKVGQFIKPSIIWIYDGLQKGFGGMYNLNPIHEGKDFLKAWQIIADKTPDYHELNKLNLYQFPSETPMISKKKAIKFLVRQTDKNIPNLVKKLEKITGMPWELGDMKLTDPKSWVSGYEKSDIKAMDLLMMPFKVLSDMTWFGDKVIRTQSVLSLERMGYTRKEAVKEASRWHGAYSEVSKRYKDTMGYITFVHTFRVLMPRQMMRVLYDPIAALLQHKDSKQRAKEGRQEKKTNKDYKRMAKSIAFTVLMPVLVDTYMKSRDWETEKFGWKWKKKVLDPTSGRQVEIVWAFNNIFNMPLKWYHRLTKPDPLATAKKFAPGFENFIKWELHPIYRLIIWDSLNNNKSFGDYERIWMPDDSPSTKAAKWSKYMFLEMFRFWGVIDEKMRPMVAGGELTSKEVIRQERIMDNSLTGLEQFAMHLFGYPYIRQNLFERQSIKQRQLASASQQWLNEIERNYTDIDTGNLSPEGYRQWERAEKWRSKVDSWIMNEME